jgi:hypothetical protein
VIFCGCPRVNGVLATSRGFGLCVCQYAYTHTVKKAKGVSKVVVKKNISFDDYKNCVLKNEPKNVKVNAIRTVKMMNYSLTQNKLAPLNKDDKRVWKNTTSTAWGHWRNLGNAPNEQ